VGCYQQQQQAPAAAAGTSSSSRHQQQQQQQQQQAPAGTGWQWWRQQQQAAAAAAAATLSSSSSGIDGVQQHQVQLVMHVCGRSSQPVVLLMEAYWPWHPTFAGRISCGIGMSIVCRDSFAAAPASQCLCLCQCLCPCLAGSCFFYWNHVVVCYAMLLTSGLCQFCCCVGGTLRHLPSLGGGPLHTNADHCHDLHAPCIARCCTVHVTPGGLALQPGTCGLAVCLGRLLGPSWDSFPLLHGILHVACLDGCVCLVGLYASPDMYRVAQPRPACPAFHMLYCHPPMLCKTCMHVAIPLRW